MTPEQAYNQDLQRRPLYEDGTKRPEFNALPKWAQDTWVRNPTPRRARLAVGHTLWNGITVTQGMADAYNATQDTIEAFHAEGRPAPQHVLDGAFNIINGITS